MYVYIYVYIHMQLHTYHFCWMKMGEINNGNTIWCHRWPIFPILALLPMKCSKIQLMDTTMRRHPVKVLRLCLCDHEVSASQQSKFRKMMMDHWIWGACEIQTHSEQQCPYVPGHVWWRVSCTTNILMILISSENQRHSTWAVIAHFWVHFSGVS